jgi:hypothetical protein
MAEEWNKAGEDEKKLGGDAASVYSYSKYINSVIN